MRDGGVGALRSPFAGTNENARRLRAFGVVRAPPAGHSAACGAGPVTPYFTVSVPRMIEECPGNVQA
ncbi:hypothetical protein GCM10027188_25070 [Lysobacter humi (ex Lee et al. 2017)]